MRIININNSSDFISIKDEIEAQLISENKIKSKMELQEFINFLQLQKNIYIKDDNVIPFRIYNDIILSVFDASELQHLISALEIIKYDLSNLKEIDINAVYLGELDKYEYYFIIDSTYKVI